MCPSRTRPRGVGTCAACARHTCPRVPRSSGRVSVPGRKGARPARRSASPRDDNSPLRATGLSAENRVLSPVIRETSPETLYYRAMDQFIQLFTSDGCILNVKWPEVCPLREPSQERRRERFPPNGSCRRVCAEISPNLRRRIKFDSTVLGLRAVYSTPRAAFCFTFMSEC